jgi:hypothetical protein
VAGGVNRRSFMAAILASSVAPAVVRAASLMPVVPLESGILVPTYKWWRNQPFKPDPWQEEVWKRIQSGERFRVVVDRRR